MSGDIMRKVMLILAVVVCVMVVGTAYADESSNVNNLTAR